MLAFSRETEIKIRLIIKIVQKISWKHSPLSVPADPILLPSLKSNQSIAKIVKKFWTCYLIKSIKIMICFAKT